MGRSEHRLGTSGVWAWAFLGPFLAVFSLFVLVPLAQSVWLSTTRTFGPSASSFVGLTNFVLIFQDERFYRAAWNTILYAALALVTQMPAGLALAMLLNHPRVRGKAWFRLAFFAPQLVGLAFLAVLCAAVFATERGLINVGLEAFTFGLWPDGFGWLREHAMVTLVVATMWMYTGFQMIYFLAALQNVDASVLEAARIDGASAWDRFLHVTLPAIRPVAAFVVLLSILGSLQLFELPMILFWDSNFADERALTLVVYLYQAGFQQRDLGYASAVGWVLAMMLIGVTIAVRGLLKDNTR
jgi:ABC-type sugar transport system permease subunit